MTRPEQRDSDHFMPTEDEIPSWLESAPDWRQFTRDEILHERFCNET